MISGPEAIAVVLMLAGVVMLGFLLMMRVRAKIARRQEATPAPRERLDEIRAAAAQRDDVHALEAELLDTSRRLVATIDSRTERLEQLIAQADARIAELERASNETPAPAPVPTSNPAPARLEKDEPRDPLTASVYQLADRGHAPVEIARELDEQIGKVELILALRDG
jgi:hypothetical protein